MSPSKRPNPTGEGVNQVPRQRETRHDDMGASGFLSPLSDVDKLRAEALDEMKRRGLHHKYDVRKRSTGEVVTDCFVLKPGTDPHARAALLAYAAACRRKLPELANDLEQWVSDVE